jgi:hypothetical protein
MQVWRTAAKRRRFGPRRFPAAGGWKAAQGVAARRAGARRRSRAQNVYLDHLLESRAKAPLPWGPHASASARQQLNNRPPPGLRTSKKVNEASYDDIMIERYTAEPQSGGTHPRQNDRARPSAHICRTAPSTDFPWYAGSSCNLALILSSGWPESVCTEP